VDFKRKIMLIFVINVIRKFSLMSRIAIEIFDTEFIMTTIHGSEYSISQGNIYSFDLKEKNKLS